MAKKIVTEDVTNNKIKTCPKHFPENIIKREVTREKKSKLIESVTKFVRKNLLVDNQHKQEKEPTDLP